MRESLAVGQWLAVVLSAAAAVGMNWSGGNRFTMKGLFWLLVTLVFYSLTDMTENHLVRMPEGGGIMRTAFGVGVTCYAILGILTLPMLWKFRWTTRQFVLAIPFAASWFFSQVALFVCFGLLGAVFGNVIQASRGLISIGIGMLLLRFGLGNLDARISRRMWLRRIAAGHPLRRFRRVMERLQGAACAVSPEKSENQRYFGSMSPCALMRSSHNFTIVSIGSSALVWGSSMAA